MIAEINIHVVPWFDRLLWAAGHSLWQGALAALIVWSCGRFITSARVKHMLAWTCLLCLLGMFAGTYTLAPQRIIEINPIESEGFEFGAMGAAMWLASFAALACLVVLRFFSLVRIVRGAGPVSAEVNQALMEAGAIASGAGTRPNTMICPSIATPAATHDRVLLPPDCLRQLDARELASVIAHENAHLRRGDFWLNVAQNLLEAALIFNPFAWYLSARIRVEREHCCDDEAVAATGDVVAYGRALAKLATGRELQPALAVAMADARVSHRIRRLSSPRRSTRGGALVPAALVAVSMTGFMFFARSQPKNVFELPGPKKDLMIKVVNFKSEASASSWSEKKVFVTTTSSASASSSHTVY